MTDPVSPSALEAATVPPLRPERRSAGWCWLNERLGLSAFNRKYGRKAFPVHSTFFLGEMALFAFVILVLTGIYLGFIYLPSNAEITINGETLPEAYASVRLIETIPVANLFRNTHHWAAHLMVAAVLLHLLRIFFTGTYRKPREINSIIGVVLLGLTLVAGFVGYALTLRRLRDDRDRDWFRDCPFHPLGRARRLRALLRRRLPDARQPRPPLHDPHLHRADLAGGRSGPIY